MNSIDMAEAVKDIMELLQDNKVIYLIFLWYVNKPSRYVNFRMEHNAKGLTIEMDSDITKKQTLVGAKESAEKKNK